MTLLPVGNFRTLGKHPTPMSRMYTVYKAFGGGKLQIGYQHHVIGGKSLHF
jgi:hypothetical protein